MFKSKKVNRFNKKPCVKLNKPTHTPAWRQKMNAYFEAHRAACNTSLKNLVRTPLGSLITLLAIALSLTLPIASLIALSNVKALAEGWDRGTSLTLYLQKSTSETQAKSLLADLLATEEIASGTYLPPDRALDEFKSWSHLDEALALLPENPLPGVITLYPQVAYESPEALNQLKQNLSQLIEVDHIVFDQEWVGKLKALLNLGQSLFLVLMGLIGIGISVVISNTVRLALEKHKEEIEVLSLIGATKAFIRRPFLYRGLWYGLLGALLSYVFVILAINQLEAPIQDVATLYSENFSLQTLNFANMLSILSISALLGWMGAWVALILQRKANTVCP